MSKLWASPLNFFKDFFVDCIKKMTAQLNNDRSDDLCFFLSQLMLGGEHHHEVPSIVESVYKPDYS